MNYTNFWNKTWGTQSTPGKRVLIIIGLTLLYAGTMALFAEYLPTIKSTVQNTTVVDSLQIMEEYLAEQQADRELVSTLELSHGSDHVNIEQAVGNLVGVTGTVNWIFDSYKNHPDVFYAVCEGRGNRRGKEKTFSIALIVNRRTGQFEVDQAWEDGKELEGPMLMLTLALAGGYSSNSSF